MKNNNDFDNIMKFLFGELSTEIKSYHPFQEMEHYFNKLKYGSINGYPPVDIYLKPLSKEDKNKYSLHFEFALSGFKKEDISIKIDENRKILKIESLKKSDNEMNNDNRYLVKKIAKREFKSEYSLPFTKVKEINSELKDGLLTIDIIPEQENNERVVDIK